MEAILQDEASENASESADETADGVEESQLVEVHPRVIENADHVLGNLFQRVYHLIDEVRSKNVTEDQAVGDLTDLEDNARQVEQCLQLLIDYVAPYPPSFDAVAVSDVAASLRSHLAPSLGNPEPVLADDPVLVDIERVQRAFSLLAEQLGAVAAPRDWLRVGAPGSSLVTLFVHFDTAQPVSASSLNELRWAVAAKLMEIQGGSLTKGQDAKGGQRWEIAIPLQS